MDDPWGNAWSATGSKDDIEDPKRSLYGPKWTTFERDADENTVDVGASSWNAASRVGWGDGPSNLWHAESPNIGAWETNAANSETVQEGEPEPGEAAGEEAEDSKDLAHRPILPTPPQSPLSLPAPFSEPPLADEPPPPSPPPGSPDPFGSFESAEVAEVETRPATWTPRSPIFPPEAVAEPWGDPWGGNDGEDTANQGKNGALNDEWELAQQARRKRNCRVPSERLGSLVAQWDELAQEIYAESPSEDDKPSSWRKGLDNVEGLAELVDSILPSTSFLPPVQFYKTAVAKAVKESLRLTRSYSVTQSGPMAHLYASKGSNDWERSVKAQKVVAHDEWGWDLKHESEEKPEPAARDKKGNGLLSFWGRKATSNSSTPPTDSLASIQPRSPTTPVKPTSPSAPARASIDVSATAASSRIASPTATTTPVSPAAAAEPESNTGDGSATQSSAVSRFFNRFTRKPSAAAATTEKENRKTLALSSNDLSFLSDVTASNPEGSPVSHHRIDSIGSLEAILSSPPQVQRYSSASSSRLPPPLAPPLPPSARCSGPPSSVSHTSDASFDAKMTQAQLMDLLVDMGSSPNAGYAPVSFDLIDSPSEGKPLPSVLHSPEVPVPRHPYLAPPSPAISSTGNLQSSSQLGTSTVFPTLSSLSPQIAPPPLSPPMAYVQGSGILPSTSPSSLPPLHHPADESTRLSSTQRFQNPLPPPPKHDLDAFNDLFLSTTSSALPQPQPSPSPPSSRMSLNTPNLVPRLPNQSGFTPSTRTGTDPNADFGDFGDFISTPMRPPSPPKPSCEKSRTANHKSTVELVESAASRPGRWPAPPSPLPQPLAPPPGFLSSELSYFNMPSLQPQQQELMGNDPSEKPAPAPGVSSASGQTATLLPPMFAAAPSRPASTGFPMHPTPPPAVSTSQSPPPSLKPHDMAPLKAPAKSGLSAQDLTFFEGL